MSLIGFHPSHNVLTAPRVEKLNVSSIARRTRLNMRNTAHPADGDKKDSGSL